LDPAHLFIKEWLFDFSRKYNCEKIKRGDNFHSRF
jgi:hypothetical protein